MTDCGVHSNSWSSKTIGFIYEQNWVVSGTKNDYQNAFSVNGLEIDTASKIAFKIINRLFIQN